MPKYYVTRGYLGFGDNAVEASSTRMLANGRPPNASSGPDGNDIRGPHGVEHDLENQGALFGAEVLCVGGRAEDIRSLVVLNLEDPSTLQALHSVMVNSLGKQYDKIVNEILATLKEHNIV